MTGFEHLLDSYDVSDQIDDIASADPPAYLRRCFAEGVSTPTLTFTRIQQLAVCAMVLDSTINDRRYDGLEAELIADWRVHYGHAFAALKGTAVEALRRAADNLPGPHAEAAAELDALLQRLASV